MKRSRALIIALLLGIILFASLAGKILVVDAPEHADVILVLAGEEYHRPARALELMAQGYAPRMVIDVPADVNMFGTSEIEFARRYFASLPQAASIDVCPITALSTRDETLDAKQCLEKFNPSRVLIVTSDYHTRRALSIFRHQLRAYSFSVAAAYDDEQFGVRWWTHRQWAKTLLEQWTRVIWWNVIERWR